VNTETSAGTTGKGSWDFGDWTDDGKENGVGGFRDDGKRRDWGLGFREAEGGVGYPEGGGRTGV